MLLDVCSLVTISIYYCRFPHKQLWVFDACLHLDVPKLNILMKANVKNHFSGGNKAQGR